MFLPQEDWFCTECVATGRDGSAPERTGAIGYGAGGKSCGSNPPPRFPRAAQLPKPPPPSPPPVRSPPQPSADMDKGKASCVSPTGRVHMAPPSARGMTAARRERNSNKHKRLFTIQAGMLKVRLATLKLVM